MKSTRLFDELFPSTAHRFDVSAVHATEWQGADQRERMCIWYAQLECDKWLAYAASYRDFTDMFRRMKFVYGLEYLRGLLCEMAGRTKKPQIDQNERAEWKGFLDRRLSDDECVELDTWEPTPTEIWDFVDRMFSDGYRLTLSYSRQTKLASCTVIDDNPARESGGYALSSSDEDGALALKMACFKFFKLLDGKLVSLVGHSSRARRG